ncbi:hypothetical protein ACVILH_004509 [Bradyrhizobium sp. USDA 4353]
MLPDQSYGFNKRRLRRQAAAAQGTNRQVKRAI